MQQQQQKRQSLQGQVGNEFSDNLGTSSRRSLQKLPIDWILVEAVLFTLLPFLINFVYKEIQIPKVSTLFVFPKDGSHQYEICGKCSKRNNKIVTKNMEI